MSITLTKDVLETAYMLISETAPFNTWGLPDGGDVKFQVVKSPVYRGWFRNTKGKPTICISSACNQTLDGLIKTMAHEMIHLFEAVSICDPDALHSATWHRLADEVCKVHSWDRGHF